jgi:flagellar assembly factor FliW
MPECESKYFGTLSYDSRAAIEFPAGLPGFENCRRFLPIEDAGRHPVIFLQSLEDPLLCFITVQVLAVDSAYPLKMSAEDLMSIDLKKTPRMGHDAEILCLAIVAMTDAGNPTANLLAPVVVNLASGRAVQSVRDDLVYDCCHPLAPRAEVAPC